MRSYAGYLIILVAGLLCFVSGIGNAHLFDWDEINFAECAREMIVSGNYSRMQIGFQPFWEKPPLFIWLQALSMHVFGISAFAARLPNALIGTMALLVLYAYGRKNYDERMARLWVLMYAGSYLSFFYFKSGIIDPLFNLLLFLSLMHLASGTRRHVLLAGIFTGLAVLTKGPVAWLVIASVLVLFTFISKEPLLKQLMQGFIWLAGSLFVTAIWFGYETVMHGTWFIETFITYQIRLFTTKDAGHGGFLLYHWIILLLGMLPASVFFIAYLRRSGFRQPDHTAALLMIAFWVVLILFTIVKTKIVHYSSFCYYPISFFAARYLADTTIPLPAVRRVFHLALALLCLLGIVVLLFIYAASHPDLISPYIRDPFAVANLKAPVQWPVWLYLIPVSVLLLLVWTALRRSLSQGLYLMPIANTVLLFLLMLFVVPRVESITQGAYISLCEEFGPGGAYLQPYGFKSYAHLFYGNLHSEQCRYAAEELLSRPDIRGKKYLICKKGKEDELRKQPNTRELRETHGYYLFEVIEP